MSKEGSAWDKDEAEEAPVQKAGSAWGKVSQTQAVSLAQVQEEEKKKELAEKEKKQQEDRQPSGTYKPSRFQNDSWGASAGGPGSGYGSRDGGYGGRDGGYGGRDSGRSYGATGGSGYGNREGGREYQPREKNPLPDRPPFTAYIGNLPFDKASEEDLDNFFGELGISDIRIAKDPATGRPKGFAYIEFNDRAGLENALAADGADFGSRKLSVDVASTRDRGDDDRNRWGPRDGSGSASGFGQRREREFDRDREPRPDSRYDSSGPNNWRAQPRATPAPTPAPSGPPKLGLQPRTKPIEEIGTPIKRGGEDPFGGASSDADKLKRQAEERLKREQESERRRQEQIEKVQREREAAKEAAQTNKGDSWRGARDKDHEGSRGGRRGGPGRYDNNWGPSSGGSGRSEQPRAQRAPELKKPMSKQETEKAEAVANPFAVLTNNDEEDNQ